ncbi:phosphatidylserine/phosphatidylglycerophosphate/cardiolipin synthase family protein [Bacteriovorax sp. Seq25_V]|uniref:phospholipase D-like domain-containing protein n=1 Tax=Bacteriovorax sp. Seq25_V TaxID=1201288 RepID=UPI000389E41C|nr:phosphatidylserine/phosphatidylglycerophosphate/cardiolipin synthase family protein [Bacteriovorax sp. Seq25_V]EQC47981.1 PLD-like domain protein [Bacteriovorax sp. Seq25_V]
MRLQSLLFAALSLFITSQSFAKTSALFSPHQGAEAFDKIYDYSASATSKLYVTVYSWSDKKALEAMTTAAKAGAEVKVVLHPTLARTQRVIDYAKELELSGGQVKIATMNMHEKFFIIDETMLINTSANLSGGAKSKYSENFIFHKIETETEKSLLKEFNQEFAVLWNTGKDFISADEVNAPALESVNSTNLPTSKDVSLYSSSMNFTLKKNSTTTKAYGEGKYFALSKRGGAKNHTWLVRDLIIKEINAAKSNIYLSLNHLNIRDVTDALIEAVKRGVDVKLAVDNQEFKTAPNNKEMTPQFVADWKKISKEEAPVRVKFYSFAPSPRYWFLNHHKYILIDFDEKDLTKTKLISGSYNISRTAEQNQFDNMVIYQGLEFSEIYKAFKGEFDHLWSLNRDSEDRPDSEIFDGLTKIEKDSISLHSYTPISLTWNETLAVRKEAYKKAPGMFKNIFRKRDCKYYGLKSGEFYGCP